jgi:lipopolysaccharide export system protein LptC
MLQLPARKNFIPLLLLMVAAASIWMFQGQPNKGPVVTPQTQSTADSFMENFTTQVLDTQGRPLYQLQAARLAHYADDDHSELTQPRFTAFRSDGQRWTVVAETGRAENGSEQIFLNGEVTIQRFPHISAPPNLQIHSRDLRVRPAEDYAETDQPTTIVQGETTLNTIGLQVHFREGRMQLLSQVRGHYVP